MREAFKRAYRVAAGGKLISTCPAVALTSACDADAKSEALVARVFTLAMSGIPTAGNLFQASTSWHMARPR